MNDSAATNEESTMYLSFDDTLASKWQSVASQSTSQYLEMQSIVNADGVDVDAEQDKTLEDKNTIKMDPKTSALIGCNETDQVSPLRPFDKSILSKHNALSSTPSKNMTLTEVYMLKAALGTPLDETEYNKENAQPDVGIELSMLSISSSVDATGSTVKANTLINDAIADEASLHQMNKTNGNGLTAVDGVLENIVEVSNEELEPVVVVPSATPVDVFPKRDNTNDGVMDEVSELIAKALKIAGPPIKTTQVKSKKQPVPPAVPMPRPRRSYLPTVSGEMRTTYAFKQRMSVVVKTTLNSPARKLAGNGTGALAASRRSCLPAPKITNGGISRKSIYNVTTENNTASCIVNKKPIPTGAVSFIGKPKYEPDIKYNCKTCGSSFRMKSLFEMHVRAHDMVENGPKGLKRLSSNTNSSGTGVSSGMAKNRCKFCDKSFALERALHIHLMENCVKIPPSEKRKLAYTELNHVKKAQLPKIHGTPVMGATAAGKANTTTGPSAGAMPPPSAKKAPKSVAHSGVFRTPTKSVPCHTCKQDFSSIIEYTNHCLKVHSKKDQLDNSKADAQSSAKD